MRRPPVPPDDLERLHSRPGPLRLLLGLLGLAMIGYGAFRILQFPKNSMPLPLFEWLLGAAILHDGILAPIVTVVGVILARAIPGRARAYVQGALVTAGLVTLVAIVLIYRQGTGAPGQALLIQNYVGHLLLILAVIAVGALALYVARVIRDRRALTNEDS